MRAKAKLLMAHTVPSECKEAFGFLVPLMNVADSKISNDIRCYGILSPWSITPRVSLVGCEQHGHLNGLHLKSHCVPHSCCYQRALTSLLHCSVILKGAAPCLLLLFQTNHYHPSNPFSLYLCQMTCYLSLLY